MITVLGLSPRIAKEEILRRHEYFGQYGKIMRIQVQGPPAGPPPEKLFVGQLPKRDPRTTPVAMGIDLGKEQDWTVVTVLNSEGEGLEGGVRVSSVVAGSKGSAILEGITSASLRCMSASFHPRAVRRERNSASAPASCAARAYLSSHSSCSRSVNTGTGFLITTGLRHTRQQRGGERQH